MHLLPGLIFCRILMNTQTKFRWLGKYRMRKPKNQHSPTPKEKRSQSAWQQGLLLGCASALMMAKHPLMTRTVWSPRSHRLRESIFCILLEQEEFPPSNSHGVPVTIQILFQPLGITIKRNGFQWVYNTVCWGPSIILCINKMEEKVLKFRRCRNRKNVPHNE